MTSLLFDFGAGHLAAPAARRWCPTSACTSSARGPDRDRDPVQRAAGSAVAHLRGPRGAGVDTIELPICDQYTLQGDLFARAILDGRPAPVPLEDSVDNMACIDALGHSVETGRWETPA